jgi:hypothetical protein
MIEPKAAKYINAQLRSRYGINTEDKRPIWRIVWSDDEVEKRNSKITPEGIELLHSQIMEFKKYGVIGIKERWVLEQLVIVPEFQQQEIGVKQSYEPLWAFQDKDGNALPPRLDACLLIINTVYATRGKKSLRNYVDELARYTPEAREARIKALEGELFGNETSVGDALAHRYGVSQSGPKFKENDNATT